MALTDLFRPKYKHSDAQVRAQAVQQMGDDDSDLLIKIAKSDKDPEVRRIAVSKIEDAEVLVDLVAKERDASVRKEAHGRAAELWSRIALGEEPEERLEAIAKLALLDDQRELVKVIQRSNDPEVRGLALAKMSDEKALADLVRQGPDSDTRLQALERVNDVDLLRAIATDETRKQLGIAAVERIDDLEMLVQVAGKAKNKHVRGRAKKRKQELLDASRPEVDGEAKRKHAERTQLVRTVKKLVTTSEWVDSHATVTAAQESWQELGDGDDDALAERFAKLCAKYFTRYETVGVKVLEAERRRREESARRAEEKEAAASQPQPTIPATVEDDEPARAAPQAEPQDEPAATSESKTPEELAEIKEQRNRVSLARLDALCIELEELASAERYRGIDKKLSQVARTFSGLRLSACPEKDELVERYEQARRQAVIRSKELREADEWKRWSVLPKLEALIKSAQELLEREDTSRIGRDLRGLQRDWKAAGPGPHAKNQEMWERFKSTCDAVYERVKEHRKVAAAEQQVNYDKKVALCEQVEEIADSTDWEETAAKIKELQREWREVGPVPRKKSKQVWQRFRSACDRFFDRRKPVLEERLEERRENLEGKSAICDKIEALATSEAEWDDVVEQLQALRQQWRGIGDVPREDYAALRKRYAEACDSVFARREEAARAKREQALTEIDDLIAKLESALREVSVDAGWDDEDVATEGDEAQLVRFAIELRAAIFEIEDLDDERIAKAQATIENAIEASPEAFDGGDLDPQASRRRRLRLIEKLEELLPQAGEDAKLEELSPEEVAAKLRDALAANALGIVEQEQRPIDEIVAEIRESWARIGPVPGVAGRQLSERFEAAAEKVLDAFATS